MKAKKLLAVISAIALIGTMTTVALAENNTKGNFSKERPVMTDMQKLQRVELTDEQKAEKVAEMKEKLAQNLADGKIIQEQYDEMIAAFENGDFSKFGGMRGDRSGFGGKKTELTDEQKAEMEAKMKEQLVQALADSKITQEKYDEMIVALEKGETFMFGGMRGDKQGFNGKCSEFDGKRSELTDEQKAEMEAKRAEMQENGKWMNGRGRDGMGAPGGMKNRSGNSSAVAL
ncbi:MAG: hypothetical protein PHZ11_02230 [Desulfitobacteriaceae bacterium]|nr:hypothetical protein [Desulfitobacteriaceae bacterium]MDD4345713.1 hypothetical protein [Desulfitobacteriaceae bacterium]MDD4401363.1 hypothetical protein [Desulfitobacteriaceae bacterium]